MPRSMWHGAIKFGMVIAPVKVYAATEKNEVSLHLVHRVCGTQIKQQRHCPGCEKVIEWGDCDRGYTVAEGQVVQIAQDELNQLKLESTKVIELIGFVPEREAPDRMWTDASYYIRPEEVGEKPLSLMVQAMRKRKRLGIGKVSLRQRERMCLFQPLADGRLTMHILRWTDEVRDEDFYHLASHKFSKPEMNLALELIDQLTMPVDLEEHVDAYRVAVAALVEAKVNSGDVQEQPVDSPTPVPKVELMEQIRQSVEAQKAKRGE